MLLIKVCGTGTGGRIGRPAVRYGTSPFRSEPRRTDEGNWERKREKEREIEREGRRKKKREGNPPEALRRTAVAVGRRNGLPRLHAENRGDPSLFFDFFLKKLFQNEVGKWFADLIK